MRPSVDHTELNCTNTLTMLSILVVNCRLLLAVSLVPKNIRSKYKNESYGLCLLTNNIKNCIGKVD